MAAAVAAAQNAASPTPSCATMSSPSPTGFRRTGKQLQLCGEALLGQQILYTRFARRSETHRSPAKGSW